MACMLTKLASDQSGSAKVRSRQMLASAACVPLPSARAEQPLHVHRLCILKIQGLCILIQLVDRGPLCSTAWAPACGDGPARRCSGGGPPTDCLSRRQTQTCSVGPICRLRQLLEVCSSLSNRARSLAKALGVCLSWRAQRDTANLFSRATPSSVGRPLPRSKPHCLALGTWKESPQPTATTHCTSYPPSHYAALSPEGSLLCGSPHRHAPQVRRSSSEPEHTAGNFTIPGD